MLAHRTFREVFDIEQLKYIIKYKNYFKTFFNSKKDDADIDGTFKILHNYLVKSGVMKSNHMNKLNIRNKDKLGVNEVNYKPSERNPEGRLYALGSLSLQGFPKFIRHTIAHKYYIDLDIVNCHPVLLSQEMKFLNIDVPYLNRYVNDRDTIINELMEKNNKTKDDIKIVIMSVLYGGDKLYNSLKIKSEWLTQFYKEINDVLYKVKNLYPDLYNNCSDRYNKSGSVLSQRINIIENDILHKMFEVLDDMDYNIDYVTLCFDGIMVLKHKDHDDAYINRIISNMEYFVKKDLGYDIKIIQKPMDDVLNMKIPKQYYDEQIKIHDKERKDFYKYFNNHQYYWKTDNYYLNDFVDYLKKNKWNSLEELCLFIRSNISRVFVRFKSDSFYYSKLDYENLLYRHLSLPNFHIDVTVYDCIKDLFMKETLHFNILIEKGCYDILNYIPYYDRYNFLPYGTLKSNIYNNGNVFNTFMGFRARILKEEYINKEKLNKIKTFIFNVFADKNIDYYNYIISWLHFLFVNPEIKNKVALVFKSFDKQIGKNCFTDFLLKYIIGENHAIEVQGVESLIEKFNSNLMNRLLIVANELSSISNDNNYHSVFNRLKGKITDNTMEIEIKYGSKFYYNDRSNYIMCTNNQFSIKVEHNDPRYCLFDCNSIYKGNYDFFKDLVENYLTNSDAANSFITYCSYFKEPLEIKNIPETSLRTNMMMMSQHPSIRFLYDIQRGYYDVYINDNDKYLCKKSLYNLFENWCTNNKEKTCSVKMFNMNVKNILSESRIKKVRCYDMSPLLDKNNSILLNRFNNDNKNKTENKDDKVINPPVINKYDIDFDKCIRFD